MDYDFVAIFDADFKPEPDFLVRSSLPLLDVLCESAPHPVNVCWMSAMRLCLICLRRSTKGRPGIPAACLNMCQQCGTFRKVRIKKALQGQHTEAGR